MDTEVAAPPEIRQNLFCTFSPFLVGGVVVVHRYLWQEIGFTFLFICQLSVFLIYS